MTVAIEGETISGEQATLFSLEDLIFRKKDKLDEVNAELKNHNDSLKSIYENDAQFSEAEQKVMEAKKVLAEHKSRIKNKPEAIQLHYKIKEVKEKKKDLQMSLSNHLISWFDLTKSKLIEKPDGTQLELRTTVTLVKG